MYFSQVQRVFIVEHYLASRSSLTCQNEFRDTFPDSPVPNESTVSHLVNSFRDTGSVQDRNRSGRPSVSSDDTLDDIRQTSFHSPRKSLRKLSLQSGLSYGIVHEANRTCIRNSFMTFRSLCITTSPQLKASFLCMLGHHKRWIRNMFCDWIMMPSIYYIHVYV
jgi:hypothetical protein